MPLYRGLIGPHKNIFRIGKILHLRILDIDGHIDQYGPLPAGSGNVERLLKDPWNILDIFYQIAVFDKRFHRSRDIRFLEYIASEQFRIYLSGNADQRYAVGKRRRNACDHIRSARAGSHRTDSDFPRNP